MNNTNNQATSKDLVWCCTASIDPNIISKSSEQCVHLHRIAGYNNLCTTDDNALHKRTKVQHDTKQIPLLTTRTTTIGDGTFPSPPKHLDLTKAPDWMEYIEMISIDQTDSTSDITNATTTTTTTSAVYDTMRGDYLIHDRNIHVLDNNCDQRQEVQQRWYIWGKEFHLQRLQKSYCSLQLQQQREIDQNQSLSIQQDDYLDQARIESENILQSLVNEAEYYLKEWATTNNDAQLPKDNNHKYIYMVRLTLLWSSNKATNTYDHPNIVVRGHACCTLNPINIIGTAIQPIQCSIAATIVHNIDANSNNINNQGNHSETTVIQLDTKLSSIPSRHMNQPQIKVAAWTKIRKKLEEPERYKPPGISEVLLVRPCQISSDTTATTRTTTISDYEILEGLSSNVFIIYKDGTLHTATDGILHGYVRQLVLNCCTSIHVPINEHPQIYLHDVSQWKEAFITSSSRLIYPISKIIIQHRYENGSDDSNKPTEEVTFRDLWHDPRFIVSNNIDDSIQVDIDLNNTAPIWLRIYNEMLRQAGYILD